MPKIPTKDSKWLCPMENCDYEAKLKHILMIHVGITHKLLLKWVDEEAEANDGKSMIVLSKSTEQVSHATVSIKQIMGLKSTFFESDFFFQKSLFLAQYYSCNHSLLCTSKTFIIIST